jgi:hypothetical protein
MSTSLLDGAGATLIDPMRWLRSWQSAWQLAPDTLVQPILPGWSFNINSNNSSAPQTEAEVVARHSYGRQLGRIADVLELLLGERPRGAAADARIDAFASMKREIDAVKQAAAADRIDRLTADLRLLRIADPARYERLRSDLLQALEP